jgi:3',5'-cyclic AMP phosphodiesterase CpdA
MPDNVALLRQALKKFTPDVIIHLGDVYYSGTVEECTANVLDVLDQIVADLKLAKRPAFFSIPGNHDYYSGGSGFYRMIGKVNSGVAGCTQQASYFCLRTEDSQWQFLGMDTGYGDRTRSNSRRRLCKSTKAHGISTSSTRFRERQFCCRTIN